MYRKNLVLFFATFNNVSVTQLQSDGETLLKRTQKISSDGYATFITEFKNGYLKRVQSVSDNYSEDIFGITDINTEDST